MAYNSWEDIYRSKKTEELYRIYKGYDYSTYNQKQLALKILTEQDFDFENADREVQKWKKQKKKKEEEFRRNKPILSFINRNFGYILSFVFGMIFLLVLSEVLQMDWNELQGQDKFAISVITFGPLLTICIGLIIQYLLGKKRKSRPGR